MWELINKILTYTISELHKKKSTFAKHDFINNLVDGVVPAYFFLCLKFQGIDLPVYLFNTYCYSH